MSPSQPPAEIKSTKCGEQRSLGVGPANSGVLAGNATRAPTDGDFRAPATRSTGFKTDLIPLAAPVPCGSRSKKAPSTGGTFPDLGLAPAGGWCSGEKEARETPPTSFSSLLRPRLSARPRRQPEGWAELGRVEPEEGPAAVSRRGVGVVCFVFFFKEK